MISEDQIHTISGGNAIDSEGNKIGSVGQIYLDDQTGNAAWVTVKTGLFGNSESFVPLHDAEVDGDGIKVPFTKDKVKDAPRVDADKHLDHDDERTLYEYYGVDYDSPAAAPVAGREGEDHEDERGDGDRVGHDTSGPIPDEPTTRSEEPARVRKDEVEAAGPRLRKYVVTEDVTITVPVTHEELRMVDEPVGSEDRDRDSNNGVDHDREGDQRR